MTLQPRYDFGGSGPLIHMAVANGFPPPTYDELLHPLTAHYEVISLPPRALWPGIGPPPEQIGTWRELTDDLLAGIRHYDLKDIIAIGHSFGAIVSMLAAIDEPQHFRALVMLDPTIMPRSVMEYFQAERARGEIPRFPLVDGALNRKHRFQDRDEAFAYWRSKSLFEDWTDAAVQAYTESMTRAASDGAGLELAWNREWEAYYYLSFYVNTWDELPRLRDLLPTLIIRAGDSGAYSEEAAQTAQEILPEAHHVTLPGYGHLFPQAAPDATRTILNDWLTTLD
jgi:pimeloyl-ACP methyl ester carboxylesterase